MIVKLELVWIVDKISGSCVMLQRQAVINNLYASILHKTGPIIYTNQVYRIYKANNLE